MPMYIDKQTIEKISASKIRKQREAALILFTHRRVFNIYLHKLRLHVFWILQIPRRPKSFPWDALVYGSIMAVYLNLAIGNRKDIVNLIRDES